ncbi:MAG TPA: peptide deformylase [Vicinamibacterales bacterium]|nr:peptide deformylase [Vicinamibacterales bacterium]
MAILKVAHMGHPVLRAKARPLSPSDIKHPVLQNLIDDMLDTMAEYHGVGLAAPQIHESLRIFVGILESVKPEAGKDVPDPEPIAIINPEITAVGNEIVEDWEGCLSIPDIRGRVPRAKEIRLRGLNREGGRIDMPLRDFPARVAQHETDHLDGVLFFDRMRTFESLTFLDEYSRYHAKD